MCTGNRIDKFDSKAEALIVAVFGKKVYFTALVIDTGTCLYTAGSCGIGCRIIEVYGCVKGYRISGFRGYAESGFPSESKFVNIAGFGFIKTAAGKSFGFIDKTGGIVSFALAYSEACDIGRINLQSTGNLRHYKFGSGIFRHILNRDFKIIAHP